MPHVCALITIAMQLTCVVDKEIICTDNESLAQLLNVHSCEARGLSSRPRGCFSRSSMTAGAFGCLIFNQYGSKKCGFRSGTPNVAAAADLFEPSSFVIADKVAQRRVVQL